RCELSLDIRAGDDATRDGAVADVLAEIEHIAKRRQVAIELTAIQRGAAVPCSGALQARLAASVTRAGIAPRYPPSGARPDAVSFAGLTDIAMLFVRCGNGGISHSPLETITAADADLAVRILIDVLTSFEPGHAAR